MRRITPRFQQPRPEVKPVGKLIKVGQHDTLEICGFEIDAETLAAVLDPDNRLLWTFVSDGAGRVQPCGIDEAKCVWLEDSDLVRKGKDDPQYVGAVERKTARRCVKGSVR